MKVEKLAKTYNNKQQKKDFNDKISRMKSKNIDKKYFIYFSSQ